LLFCLATREVENAVLELQSCSNRFDNACKLSQKHVRVDRTLSGVNDYGASLDRGSFRLVATTFGPVFIQHQSASGPITTNFVAFDEQHEVAVGTFPHRLMSRLFAV
jgi:hypothetical protein